jgi:CobQ-like glutamine amidotransferase family enzyme
MEIRIVHFYPDLMSLYGSYANGAVLKRRLEQLGPTVTVEPVDPGQQIDLSRADFLFMGAGTERAQKAALADFARFGEAVKAAAARGVAMLFAGTAMELLGRTITDAEGKSYDGIGLADFTTVQGKQRLVEDVYGRTELFPEAVVGFMNKCGIVSGVETPLLTELDLGFGNEAEKGPEGFHWNNVFASQLTGPILVKNPRLLDTVIGAIYQRRGETLPQERPVDRWAEDGYAITAEQLRLRCGK